MSPVKFTVDAPEEVEVAEETLRRAGKLNGNHTAKDPAAPRVFNVADLLALDTPAPAMLIENVIPERGASLIVGAAKSNKTLIAVQIGIAVASGNPWLDNYRILKPGPVLIVEQDDPAGAASVKTILAVSPVPVAGIPFSFVGKVPFNFGSELLAWLEEQIITRLLRLVVLDSYTALRGSRGSGIDIVKAEQHDLTMLDELAKRTGCAVIIIHHASKGSAALDWSDQAAGTFAMSAATESQMHVARFRDLDGNAPERLIRIRGRHQEGLEMVVRFRKDTLDHELALEGGAAPLYPLVLQLRTTFGAQTFGPKELAHATGVSRATAFRQIDRLFRASVLSKRGYGEYVLSEAKL
jgi:hypothetical protein